MAKTYRGLTVELNAETSGLGKALKDVNKKSRDVRTELRKVERLLKFNPNDTELLAQKQKLLSDRVENTSEKLNRLKKVEGQIKQQFESGEIGEQQYRDFQRELKKTESKLETFEGQLRRASSQSDKLARKLNQASGQLQSAGEKLTGVGDKLTMGLTVPLTGAFVGLTQGTRDFRKEISVLDNNIESANASSENINKAMAKTKAVTDDTQASVEGLSNLLAADFKGDQFQEILDNLNGAALKFKETIKFEEVSNALQETLGSGEAVGQFAELLERSGVQLEKFEEGLAKAKKQGKEHNYVLETLASTGLSNVYEQYRKNNEELVNSAEATYNLKEELGELGNELEPIMTRITQSATEAVSAFNDLDRETQSFLITGAGVAGALGPAISTIGQVSMGLSGITSTTSKLIKATGGLELSVASLTGAFTPLLVGGTIAAGLIYITHKFKEAREEAELLKEEVSDIANIDRLGEQLDVLDKRIRRLKTANKSVTNEDGELYSNLEGTAKDFQYQKRQKELNKLFEKKQKILMKMRGLEYQAKAANDAEEEKKEQQRILDLIYSKNTAYRAGRLEKEEYKDVLQGIIDNEENSNKVIARARSYMQGLTSDAKDLDSAVSNVSNSASDMSDSITPDYLKTRISYNEVLKTSAKEGEKVKNTIQDLSDEYHQNAVNAVENAEKLQERYDLEQKWANELYQVKDKNLQEELARLEKEKQVTIKKAKEKGADVTDKIKAIEKKKDKVREKYVKKQQKQKDRIMKYKLEQEEISYETYVNYLKKRLSEEEKYFDEWFAIQEEMSKVQKEQIEKYIEVWEELADNLQSNFSDAFEAIIDDSKSSTEAFEDLWDDAISNIGDSLGKLANIKITDSLDFNGGILGNLGESILGGIGGGLVSGAIDWLGDALSDLGDEMFGSDTAAASWNKKYRKLRKKYNKEFGKISDFEISTPDFANLVDKDLREINKKVEDGGWFHSDDYEMVKNLPRYSEEFKQKMKELSEEIIPKLNSIFDNIQNNLKGAFSADTFSGFLDNFGGSLRDTITSNLKEAFLESKAIQPLMKELTGSIYEATKDGALDQAEKERIKEDYENVTNESKDFFEGLKDIEDDLEIDLGISGDTSYSSSSTSGGNQVSEITGETRDLFEDLLTPLANFPSLVSINERIYEQLNMIRKNISGGMSLAGAGNVDVRIDNLNVESQNNSGESIAYTTADEVERIVTKALKDGRRGQGK